MPSPSPTVLLELIESMFVECGYHLIGMLSFSIRVRLPA